MDVVILGAGGHGRVVLEILRAGGRYSPIGFIDANTSLAGTQIGGVPVLGAANQLPKLRQSKLRHAIVAIGDNRTRQRYAQTLVEHGFELINAIHPSASIASSATLGANVVVAAGAVICTDARIGDCVIVNTNAVVDHECEIGDAVHVCPGALLAGRVRVGDGAFVGLGAKVIQCLSIGELAVIGAGAVVLKDVPAGATAVGVPARIVKVTSPAMAA
jgi:UDP-perosamine 4-acetyltransferase